MKKKCKDCKELLKMDKFYCGVTVNGVKHDGYKTVNPRCRIDGKILDTLNQYCRLKK